MPSVKMNLVVEQGADFLQTYTNSYYQTSNSSVVAGQIRRSYYSKNTVPFIANVTNSVFTLSLPANTTCNMWPGRYVYDVVLTSANGSINRILEGILTVNPNVTRLANQVIL